MLGIQDIYLNIGKSGCLLMDYIMAIGINPSTLINDYYDLVEKKIIDTDCSVLNADKLLRFYIPNTDLWVDKCSLENAKGEYICVKYNYKTYYHWVLYKNINDKYVLFWNSMENSSCVKNGKPDFTSVRDISNKKVKPKF